LPVLAPLLDIGPEPSDGGTHVPRVMSFGKAASERFAVRPGAEAEGLLHMPGGQSGHRLSPWYRTGHAQWLHGVPSPFLPGPEAHRLVLVPPP
jgi:penicillin amidase